MKKILTYSLEAKDQSFVKMDHALTPLFVSFMVGQRIESTSKIFLFSDYGVKTVASNPALLTSLGIPIVSDEFIEKLPSEALLCMEIHPVTVRCTDGDYSGFNIVNIVINRNVIDLESSDYSEVTAEGTPLIFEALSINEDALGPDEIVRDLTCKTRIFVGENLQIYFASEANEIFDIVVPSKILSPQELYE